MMKLVLLFTFTLVLVFFLPNSAVASDWQEVGNGGDALVCERLVGSGGGMGRYVNMYDFIEAEVRYNLVPQLPTLEHQEDFKEIVLATLMLKRIQGVSEEWLNEAQRLIENFYLEARLMRDVELVDVADTGMGFIPKSCVLKQLFLQAPPISQEDRYYKVSADIWIAMFPEQRATGILHEVLYRLSPKARASFSSEKIRYVIALLLADQFKKKSFEESQQILKSAGLL